MNLNELRDRAYKTACDRGFHDEELSNEHCLCLVISELMEAVEADRKGGNGPMLIGIIRRWSIAVFARGLFQALPRR